ncbi:hypothetical protein PENTCL1PPCAC_15993, partial [Pristionchus entomophagus]
RKRAVVNAFYTIYMAGCFPDVIALINAVFMYCGIIGFLKAHLITSTVVVFVRIITYFLLSIITLF